MQDTVSFSEYVDLFSPSYAKLFTSLFSIHSYNPRQYYEANPELRQAIDQLASGYFSPEAPDQFREIADHLLNHDR